MSVSPEFADHVRELFGGLGPLRNKPMFGVVAIYADDLIFAIIADDVLYLRTDAETEARFRAAGSEPFIFVDKDGRETPMSYWRAPDEALDDQAAAEDWGRLSLEVALRKQAKKRKKRKA